MAILPGQFNSDEYDDMGTFDAIPQEDCKDWFIMHIEDSSIKPTKKALDEAGIDAQDSYSDAELNSFSGLRLNLQFKVLAGKYKDRTVFNGLNIKNSNPQAVEISQKELATICRAVGRVNIQDSAELHGIPMRVKLGYKPANAQYDASNTFKNYEPHDGSPIESGSEATPSKPVGKKKLFD